MKSKEAENTLYEIASSQGGYFTALQAKHAGISEKNHHYHVRAGNWIREWRGIFRLVRFPLLEDAQYSLWGIWSMSRNGTIQGVFSHETALSLFELSDLQPEKLHMTLPRGYRRHSEIPKVLILHYAKIDNAEYEERRGYKVTKLYRTIMDIIRAQEVSPEFVKQTITQAIDKGYLTQEQYRKLKVQPRIGRRLLEIMGDTL